MLIDVITAILVGLLGAASAVMLVRGLLGLIAEHRHAPYWWL